MKKSLLLTAIFYVLYFTAIAQTPQAFKYQAIARDEAGNILSNWELDIRISILQEDAEGEAKYVENHKVISSIYGLINLVIGEGSSVKGNFDEIEWGRFRHYIKLEMDVSGKGVYSEMGTSQLFAVPYALYAEQAGFLSSSGRGSSSGSSSSSSSSSGSGIGRSIPNCRISASGDSFMNFNSGKLGIGTSMPEYMLDVAGNINLIADSSLKIGGNTLLHNRGLANIAIGEFALESNIDGSNNTALGYRAGWNALGDGNIFLGHKAGYFETGSDKLYIDNSDTAKPLIYGDFLGDSLVVYGHQSIYQINNVGQANLFVSNDDGYSPFYYTYGRRGIYSSVSSASDDWKTSIDARAYGNGSTIAIWAQAESLSDDHSMQAIGVNSLAEAIGETPAYGVRSYGLGKKAWGVHASAASVGEEGSYLMGVEGNAYGAGANSSAIGVYGSAFLQEPNSRVIGVMGSAVSHGGPQDSTWAAFFLQNLFADKIAAGVWYKSPGAETQVHIRNTTDDNFGILINAFDTVGSSIGLHAAKSKYASLVKNAYFNGGWYRFDESSGAFKEEITPAGDVRFMVAPSGTNPIVWNYGMFIHNAGNVGIGTDTPDQKLSVYGNANKKDGGTSWATWSDERLKTDIEPIKDALDRVCRLEGVHFNWKDHEKSPDSKHMGVIAQDVEKVIPEWVFEDQNGYKMFQPEGFEGLIVEAIKEQQEIIEALQQRIKELEARLGE